MGTGDMLEAMDLRDRFAVHFAAALVDALTDPEQIASRAYDLAEAMLRERDHRVDQDEGVAIAEDGAPIVERSLGEPPFGFEDDASSAASDEAYHATRAALLDDPEPMEPEAEWADDEDLPDWLEAPYDPRWELEARWADADAGTRPVSSRPPGPGLARTQPEQLSLDDRPARSSRGG
jgi:hypothetical protein